MDAKNLKEVVILGCKAFDAYLKAKADGKIDASDILYLVPLAQAIGPAIQDIGLVPAEALDLDKAELADLIAAVRVEVPSLKDAADALIKIEAVMNLLVAAKDCYMAFAKGQPSALGLSGLNMDKGLAAAKVAQIQSDRAMTEAPAVAAPAVAAPVVASAPAAAASEAKAVADHIPGN